MPGNSTRCAACYARHRRCIRNVGDSCEECRKFRMKCIPAPVYFDIPISNHDKLALAHHMRHNWTGNKAGRKKEKNALHPEYAHHLPPIEEVRKEFQDWLARAPAVPIESSSPASSTATYSAASTSHYSPEASRTSYSPVSFTGLFYPHSPAGALSDRDSGAAHRSTHLDVIGATQSSSPMRAPAAPTNAHFDLTTPNLFSLATNLALGGALTSPPSPAAAFPQSNYPVPQGMPFGHGRRHLASVSAIPAASPYSTSSGIGLGPGASLPQPVDPPPMGPPRHHPSHGWAVHPPASIPMAAGSRASAVASALDAGPSGSISNSLLSRSSSYILPPHRPAASSPLNSNHSSHLASHSMVRRGDGAQFSSGHPVRSTFHATPSHVSNPTDAVDFPDPSSSASGGSYAPRSSTGPVGWDTMPSGSYPIHPTAYQSFAGPSSSSSFSGGPYPPYRPRNLSTPVAHDPVSPGSYFAMSSADRGSTAGPSTDHATFPDYESASFGSRPPQW